jgi:rare lipoprotein A
VTNLENGRVIVVRVNDRGPFVGDRIIDLSRRAAETLDMKNQGTARMRVQYIRPAPLNDKGMDLVAMNRALNDVPVVDEVPAAATLTQLITDVSMGEDRNQPVADQSLITGSLPVRSEKRGFFIQVGWFADSSNAERTRSRLANIGPVKIDTTPASSDSLSRVRIGPLDDADTAQAALREVIDAGYTDARLITSANAP